MTTHATRNWNIPAKTKSGWHQDAEVHHYMRHLGNVPDIKNEMEFFEKHRKYGYEHRS